MYQSRHVRTDYVVGHGEEGDEERILCLDFCGEKIIKVVLN